MDKEKDRITLKWGTLKSWSFNSYKCRELAQKYFALGSSLSAIAQKDTPEQKQLLCELIDASTGDGVFLDWDGKHVSKEEAKKYVMSYDND